jgi:hypothetical protein
MIDVTPMAQEKLGAYFKEQNLEAAVRVYLAQGG